MISAGGKILDGIGDGRRAGSRGQRARAPFQGGHALLEDVRGGIHDAGIDVAVLLQSEERLGVVAIVENIGAGLVNRNGARCCGAVWFLARMNLKRFKMQILFHWGHLRNK